MANLKIFNTMDRMLEDFHPNDPEEKLVKMYQCGPTVYGVQHIGNMRAAYVGDVVFRTLKYLSYDVDFVKNYTDVGHLDGDNAGDADTGTDKIEKGAQKEGLSPEQIAEKYIAQYDIDVEKLGTERPTHTVRATETIKEQVEMIKSLYEKGYVYATLEALYYDVTKFPDYNKLNRQKPEENQEGAGHGTAETEHKKNPHDFAVWFFRNGHHLNHLQHWSLKEFWGENFPKEINDLKEDGDGFPGWHIECSAMSKLFLGPKLDIHIGGIEHIPTHHTNEIAQSEAANGESPYVKYWIHFEHLLIDGGKMAKSMGNGYSIGDLENKGFSALDLRYFFLNAHYRSQQNFTWEALEGAKNGYKNLVNKIVNIQLSIPSEPTGDVSIPQANAEPYKKEFEESIDDDFNTSKALGVLNKLINADDVFFADKLELIYKFDEVLGLQIQEKVNKELSSDTLIDMLYKEHPELEELISHRNQAKSERDYTKADKLRDEINKILDKDFYKLQDNPDGTSKIVGK